MQLRDRSVVWWIVLCVSGALAGILTGLYLRSTPPATNEFDRPRVPVHLVLLGATGDLSTRYLLPALRHTIPQTPILFRLYLASRQHPSELRSLLEARARLGAAAQDPVAAATLLRLHDDADYAALCANLPVQHRVIFYLSIPPSGYEETVRRIVAACGGFVSNKAVQIVLEKPFGLDAQSAQRLFSSLEALLNKDAFYLVDHYKAKEAVQAIPQIFLLNPHLQSMLHPANIGRIEVVLNETEDVSQRIGFFEETGVIRDVVQNHLMELLTDILLQSGHFPSKPAILQQLHVERLHQEQYSTYIQEAADYHQKPEYKSTTATFIHAHLKVKDPRWAAVRLEVSAGKKLSRKVSAARIVFTAGEELVFFVGGTVGLPYPAVLLRGDVPLKCPVGEALRVAVDVGGGEADYWACPLGSGFRNAYEAVLEDVCSGRWTLGVQWPFVLNSWRLWDPWIQDH